LTRLGDLARFVRARDASLETMGRRSETGDGTAAPAVPQPCPS
jgi:hypothetical protein